MIIQIIQLSKTDAIYARFRKKGHNLEPVSGIRFNYEKQEELQELLLQNIYRSTEDLKTILAIPPSMLSLREMHLPFSDRRKIRAVLPIELAGDSAEELQEPACDAILLATGTQMAGWADSQEISSLISMFASIGMEPEVVTSHPLAWHYLSPPEHGPAVLIDREALAVVENGSMLFCRIMDTSDRAEVARTIDALEISRSIRAKNAYRVDAPPLEGEKQLPIPAELTALPSNGDLPPSSLISALAMARALQAGEIFNLRNGQLAWKGAGNLLLKRLRIPAILASVLIILLFLEAGLRWYLLQKDIKGLNGSITAIYKSVFPARTKSVDEAGEIKSEIRKLRGNSGGADLLQFLSLMARLKDDKIQGFTEVEYDSERFRLKGDAQTSQAVTTLAEKLSSSGLSVEQPEITGRPDGTSLFVIKGRHKGVAND